MFCGGLAEGEARRAPCTAKKKKLEKKSVNEGRGRCLETDLAQRRHTTYSRFEQRRSAFGEVAR